MRTSFGRQRIWGMAALVSTAVALYLSFIYAPTERSMGEVQRVFYFHVASAWNAFLAFFVVFVASIAYLRTRERRWDRLAYASGEVGVIFTTLVLITGPIWARPIWNTWWTWDPRLTTTLILWFTYVAYLIIRSAAEGSEQQARLAAVFGIVGFVNVPIVHMSIRWWRSIHPAVITSRGIEMEPPMIVAMVGSVVAFTFLYLFLISIRQRLEGLAEQVFELKEAARRRVVEAPVERPRGSVPGDAWAGGPGGKGGS